MSGEKSSSSAAERARKYRERKKAEREEAQARPSDGSESGDSGNGDGTPGTGAAPTGPEKIVSVPSAGLLDAAALPDELDFPGTATGDVSDAGGVTVLAPTKRPTRPRKPAPTGGKPASPYSAVKTPKTPALSKTASRMVSGLFSALAGIRGPHWKLDDEESDEIGAAFADVVGSLPPGLASTVTPAITAIAAPLALIGAVGAPIGKRIAMEQQYMAQLAQQQQAASASMEAQPRVHQHPPSIQTQEPRTAAGGVQEQANEAPAGADADSVQPRHVSIFAAGEQHSARSGGNL